VRTRIGRRIFALGVAVATVLGVATLTETASAAAAPVSVVASADTYVAQNFPTTNYGGATTMAAFGTPDITAYLRFAVPTLPAGMVVSSAVLRIRTASLSSAGSASTQRVLTANDSWAEPTTVYGSRPALGAQVGSLPGPTLPNTWYDVPLTAATIGGAAGANVSLAVVGAGSDSLWLQTRESASKPTLIVTFDQATAPTNPTTAPAPPGTFDDIKQVAPSADTYVAQNLASNNYGASQSLAAYGTPVIVPYLRFALPTPRTGQTLVAATLKIRTTTEASAGSLDTQSVYRTGATWTESTMLYAGRPAVTGSPLGVLAGGTVPNTTYAVGLSTTSLAGLSGELSLALISSGSDSLRFSSRESAFDPILELTYRGPPPPLDPPTPGASAVVLAAGDLVCPPGTTVTTTTCKHQEVHDLVVGANPDRFIALGDLAQGLGSYAEFMAPGRYNDTFGHLRDITLPVVGNHEGFTAGAQGYFDYWYGAGINTGAFGDRPGGYYTTTIGSWRFIALSSECDPGDTAGGCQAGGPEYRWLESVLARNTAPCTVVAYHRPRWTTGFNHGPYVEMSALWDLMAAGGVDITLSGHNHLAEVFRPIGVSGDGAQPTLSATGIRSFTVGTGGASQNSFNAPGSGQFAALDVRARGTFGALRLDLRPTGYSWQLLPIAGSTFTNSGTTGSFSGTGDCH
jgi:hypothetical protein